MYVITGATGNTGKIVAKRLLEAGKTVKVIGRSAEKLQPLVDNGATAAVGSLDEQDFMNEAFDGATAVYAMIPPNFTAKDFRAYQNAIGRTISDAIANGGVRYVVQLSSVGAHLPEGTGPIGGLYAQEQRLNRLEGSNVLHLRAGYFMENLLINLDMIKNMGLNGSGLRGDLPIGMIATADIGEYAARRLLNLDISGKQVQALLGERDLTLTEATAVLGKAIGKEGLPYVQFPYEDVKKALLEMGASEDTADYYVEMTRAFNDEIGVYNIQRNAENTTTTSIEEFAQTFAAIYNQ